MQLRNPVLALAVVTFAPGCTAGSAKNLAQDAAVDVAHHDGSADASHDVRRAPTDAGRDAADVIGHPDATAFDGAPQRDATSSVDASSLDASSVDAPGEAETSPPLSVSPAWSDSNLPPEGWRPVSYTGLHAPDAYHIPWSALCASGTIACNGSDPKYDDASSAKIAAVVMGSAFGVIKICDGAGVKAAPDSPTGTPSPCNAGDYGVGTYFSHDSDPVYKIHCTAGWGCGYGVAGDGSDNLEGEMVHIPLEAIPQMGGDSHLFVMNEDTGIECGFWVTESQATTVSAETQYFLTAGGTLNIGSGGCGSLRTDLEGQGTFFAAMAAQTEPVSTLLRAEELLGPHHDGHGYIDHALYLSVSGNNHQVVYPAAATDGVCGSAGPNSEGEVIYLDTAGYDALMASGAAPWKKTWLAAAHDFGFYDLDSSGCGGNWTNFLAWGGGSYVAAGVPDPWDALAALAATDPNPNDFSVANDLDSYNLDLSDTGLTQANFHVLALAYVECVMKGTNCP